MGLIDGRAKRDGRPDIDHGAERYLDGEVPEGAERTSTGIRWLGRPVADDGTYTFTADHVEIELAPPLEDRKALLLDGDDSFEAVLIDMVRVYRAKRRDYAVDGNMFSNFVAASATVGIDGFGPQEAAVFNIAQKLARLKALRANGRMARPENETVADTCLDMAVYAVILTAMCRAGIRRSDTIT